MDIRNGHLTGPIERAGQIIDIPLHVTKRISTTGTRNTTQTVFSKTDTLDPLYSCGARSVVDFEKYHSSKDGAHTSTLGFVFCNSIKLEEKLLKIKGKSYENLKESIKNPNKKSTN